MPRLPSDFWGHLTELAKRMKVVIYTFVISAVVMLVLPGNADFLVNPSNYQPLVSVFLRTIRERVLSSDVRLIALQITDPISLYVTAAFTFSAAITMPVLAYEVYKFVNPALYPHEKKAITPFVTAVTTLFVAGAVFGFFLLFPAFVNSMFPFFTAVGAELMFSIMDFYNLLFFTVIMSGFIFTIPAFFVLLVKFRILQTEMFRRRRKYIYLGIVVLALFISPGATPLGDLYMFVSLAALFEVSMLVAAKFEPPNLNQIPKPACKFCKKEIDQAAGFCPYCNKSLR
ncbi:MAG: twin-arginine translocase subunit TatC [Candidatus Bathyarchaeia archaeon]